MYDNRIFHVSDTATPIVDSITFKANVDGTYDAKLFGLFNMGTCEIEHVSRPTIDLLPYTVVCRANSDYPVIQNFLNDHTPAEACGMKIGDYIVSVNDHELSNIDFNWGDYVSEPYEDTKFVILRNREYYTFYCRPDKDTGMFGVSYSAQELEQGTISLFDNGNLSDYKTVLSIGHNVLGDLYSEFAYIGGLVYIPDNNTVFATISDEISAGGSGLLTLNQDDYGLISVFDEDFLRYLSLRNITFDTESLELAWNWEISPVDTAFVLIPYDGVTDESGHRLYTPVPVKVSRYNGTVVNIYGEVTAANNDFVIEALYPTYKESIELLKDSNSVIADDYSITEDINFEFLAGMSGSPVVQNGRLIGVVTAVDVQDTKRAYMLDAEQLYMHYYDFATDSTYGSEVQ